VLVVGFLQAYLQRQHVRQDLFDKRYTVYAAVDAYLAIVLNNNGQMDEKAVHAFRSETAHAEFLFGGDITEFLDLIFSRSMDLAVITAQIARHVTAINRFQSGETTGCDYPEGEMLIDLTPPQTELITWFVKAQEQRNEVFRPYLQLHRDLPWYARFEQYMNELLAKLDEMLNREKDEGRRRAGR
jgi:hypothetical protein